MYNGYIDIGNGILISFRSRFGPFQWLSLSLSWEYNDNDNGCRYINHGFCWICQYLPLYGGFLKWGYP